MHPLLLESWRRQIDNDGFGIPRWPDITALWIPPHPHDPMPAFRKPLNQCRFNQVGCAGDKDVHAQSPESGAALIHATSS
jgi:hypothetical protein